MQMRGLQCGIAVCLADSLTTPPPSPVSPGQRRALWIISAVTTGAVMFIGLFGRPGSHAELIFQPYDIVSGHPETPGDGICRASAIYVTNLKCYRMSQFAYVPVISRVYWNAYTLRIRHSFHGSAWQLMRCKQCANHAMEANCKRQMIVSLIVPLTAPACDVCS